MRGESLQQYVGEVRAYFAPVAPGTGVGAMFDPAQEFDLENPPLPWIGLGPVRNFKRHSKSAMGAVRTGTAGVVQTQYRKVVEAGVSLDFCRWGKLQMALAAGSEHMNVLESAGGAARAGVPLLAGSTAQLLVVDGAALGSYSAGELVVVDVDYAVGMTRLGTGITGGVVEAGAALDADAVRRVSWNVASISGVSASGVALAEALPGGAPAAGARVQQVVGFVDREGAGVLPEWSALFVLEELGGGRVSFYYPRLQAAAGAAESVEEEGEGVSALRLHGDFVALASSDANDGESVVCYRALRPAAGVPAW